MRVVVLVAAIAWGSSGCLPQMLRPPAPDFGPPVFTSLQPTKEEIINVVNANSFRISQLQSESASLRVSGIPAMRGNLAIERPRRFRLKTDIFGLPGTGLDLGSNEELFWIWIEQSQPPGVYYARHDEFAASPARQMFPVAPEWLIEALGVVFLDPAGLHEGPYRRGTNELEIRSRIPTPHGDVTKTTVIHDRYGWVLEQHLHDAAGQLIASSRTSQHRHYPAEGVTLPHRAEVQFAPGGPLQMSFRIDVSNYLINRLYGDPGQLWSIPQPRDYPLVNIADTSFQPQAASGPVSVNPPSRAMPRGRGAFQPQYRGMMR